MADQSFFQRLTRLFRSGPTIRRKIKGQDYKGYYDKQVVQNNLGYYGASAFKKEASPFSILGAYGILDRMSRYAEFSEMEYCLCSHTLIAVPGGYKTIKELADEYGMDKEFIVYSYDHNKGVLVPALAKQARLTKTDKAYKVTFDNGKEIIGSADHRLMKRDGTYSEIRNLMVGTAMMPFYRKSFFTTDLTHKETTGEYLSIYTMDKEASWNGWQSEHSLIAAWADRPIEKDEVVHHKDFCRSNNHPSNLEIMTEHDHKKYHAEILNGKKWDTATNGAWIEKFKAAHSTWMRENNPAQRTDITFPRILQFCQESGFNLYETCRVFGTDPNVIKRHLRQNGFNDFVTFAKAYDSNWKQGVNSSMPGAKNPRFKSEVTFERICNEYQKGMTGKQLAGLFQTSVIPIRNRLLENGYSGWTDFTERYANMKVVSVEYYGEIPLYDLTVDGYKNFATDSVISHNTSEIATALDLYADESFAGDEHGKSLHVYSDNPEIRKALTELFEEVGNVEIDGRRWIRNLVKFGDFFLYNEVVPDVGVINIEPIPVNEIEREEGFDPEDPYAVRFKLLSRGGKILENWQVTHFRIMSNDLFLPYGTSFLESSRRVWRQLIMMEDAMLVYRVVRSPERRVFYIDVSGVAANDIPTYMEAVKETMRGASVVDKFTGRMDQRYNPVPVDEDYFLPARPNSQTKIESLAGGQHVSATEDVEYIHKKLVSALKVPSAYLGYDEALSSKATLAQMDIRFSRTITMLQKILIAELNKLAIIHLYAKGFEGEDLIDFEIRLSNPSSIAMQQKLQLTSTRINTAAKAWDLAKETDMFDMEWIQKEILGFRMDDIIRMRIGRQQDELRVKTLTAMQPTQPEEGPETKVLPDPFDPSNYRIPGGPHQETEQEKQQARQPQLAAVKQPTAVKPMLKVNLGPGGVPITPNRQASTPTERAQRRMGRSKEFSGIAATSMPDFQRMLDTSKNRTLSDPYDKEFLRTPFRENIEAEIRKQPNRLHRRLPEGLSLDTRSALQRFDEMHRKSKQEIDFDIITEGETIDMDEADDLLLLEAELKRDGD